MGYRWENLEESAISLYFDWEIYGARGVKPTRILLWNISIVAIRKKDSK